MKSLALLSLLFSTETFSYDQDRGDELVCVKEEIYNSRGSGISISCVSKASIERDKLHSQLLRLQIKELKAKMKREADQIQALKDALKDAK